MGNVAAFPHHHTASRNPEDHDLKLYLYLVGPVLNTAGLTSFDFVGKT
jgi:hypothetical protein